MIYRGAFGLVDCPSEKKMGQCCTKYDRFQASFTWMPSEVRQIYRCIWGLNLSHSQANTRAKYGTLVFSGR